MPTSPETLKAIVIINTSIHIFRGLDLINQGHTSGNFPNCIKFKPNEYKCAKT